MKLYNYFFAMLTLLIFVLNVNAQLVIQNGAKFTATGNLVLGVNNFSIANNDAQSDLSEANLFFSGSINNTVEGGASWRVKSIFLSKQFGTLQLNTNLQVIDSIRFSEGLVDLNKYIIHMEPGAILVNESEKSKIFDTTGGYIFTTATLNSPAQSNPGNLGLIISSAEDLGLITIRRRHTATRENGIAGSIFRNFEVIPANNNSLNATLRFHYFDSELNNIAENKLALYRLDGTVWQQLGIPTQNDLLNYIESSGIPSMSRFTLGPLGGALPVTGLEFFAKRINNSTVQLDWRTIQENYNKGFFIERKKENEINFIPVDFVSSNAVNGTSSLPLAYSKIDQNNFAGNSYYRLKQVDIDGKSTYSLVRIVKGEAQRQLVIQAWPIPSNGLVNVMVKGLQNPERLMVFDAAGKLIQQHTVQNSQSLQLNALKAGIYTLKLAGNNEIVQRIVVQ